MTKNYKKLGFSLAELVLSMVIIGTIAMLTLPIIRGKSPNKEMIMFKKTYGVCSKAIKDMIHDEDLYPTGLLSDTSAVSYNGVAHSDADKFCGLLAAHLTTVGTVTCGDGSGNFTTIDGVKWKITSCAGTYYIDFDVNDDATPNCRLAKNDYNPCGSVSLCSDNAKGDIFTAAIENDGGITVQSGGVEEKYLNSTDNTKRYSEL